jgi:gluconolactonase
MKSKVAFGGVLCFLGCITAFGQEGGGRAPQAVPTDTVAPSIPGVVAGGTKVHVLKIVAMPGNTEGPVGLPDGSLVFAEVAASKVWKIDKDDKISLLAENTSGAVGMGLDSKGRLIACVTQPPGQTKIGVIYPKGQEAVLADNVNGEPLGRPNDLVVNKKGGIYFTDPGPNEAQLKAGYHKTEPAVYYIPSGGKAIKVADVMGRPNGIQLSPDEKILYVNNSFGEYLLAFDIQQDGTVRNQRNFAKYDLVKQLEPGVSVSDGLASDSEGRLYVANQSVRGIQVFSPQGQSLGTNPLSRSPQNLAFAGPGKKTLYVTGGGYAFKVQMLTQGVKGRAK